MSSFQNLEVFLSQVLYKTEREPVLTPLSFCLRVIVKEKPQNHEKTTSFVVSALLLIYFADFDICKILTV